MPSVLSAAPRPVQHSPAPAAWPLVGALLATAALFVALFAFFVLTSTGQRADEEALHGAQDFLAADAPRAASLAWLNQLPQAVGIACALGLIVCAWVRRDVVVPLIGAAAAGLAMVSTQLLKHELLSRPDLGISVAWGNSFPSGHTTAAAAATVALLIAAPARARAPLAVLGALLSAVTGAATLVMGWHRPSDVVGAFLVSAFFFLLGSLAVGAVQRMRERRGAAGRPGPDGVDSGTHDGGREGRVPSAVTGVALACGLVLAALGAILGSGMTPGSGLDSGPGRSVLVGLLCIGGAAFLLFPGAQLVARRWMR